MGTSLGYNPAAHDRYEGTGSILTFALGFALFAIAVVCLLFGLAFEEPQVTYTCNPEQPHLSVKECVR